MTLVLLSILRLVLRPGRAVLRLVGVATTPPQARGRARGSQVPDDGERAVPRTVEPRHPSDFAQHPRLRIAEAGRVGGSGATSGPSAGAETTHPKRPARSRERRATRLSLRIVIPLALVAALTLGALNAAAYFTATSSVNTTVPVGSLNAATRVTATTGAADAVSVAWTDSSAAGNAVAPAGYYVTRTDSATSVTTPACGTSESNLTAPNAAGCTDSNVPYGTYSYTVVARLGSWRATSAATAPLPVLSPTTTGVSAPATDASGSLIPASGISATLAGATENPLAGGSVTFTVFGPQANAPADCTSGGTAIGTPIAVSGSGSYNPTAGYTPAAAGTYYWYAAYSGDPANGASNTGCGTLMTTTIVRNATTTTLDTPAGGSAGTRVDADTIAATLAGATTAPQAGGTLGFVVFGPQASAPTDCTTGGTTVGTASASGSGTFDPGSGFTPTVAGDYWWYAGYGGDALNSPSHSDCGPSMAETVVGEASSVLSASGPVSGMAGVAISAGGIGGTLAGVSGANASGTVTFTVFGPQALAPTVCSSGGALVGSAVVSGGGGYQPSAGVTPTAAGDYWWFARYGGDSNNAAASSVCGAGMAETVVGKASPSLSASGPVSGTAGVAIAAGGIGGTLGGVSGANASGAIAFTVFGPQASAPTVCSTGGAVVGSAAVGGGGSSHSSAGLTPTVAGDYWWYASYGGDANNAAVSSACGAGMAETVVAAATPTLSAAGPATGMAGTAITASSITAALAATSGANASGTITLTVFGPQTSPPANCASGGTTVGTGSVGGNGGYSSSTSFTPVAAGGYWWYASYAGDSNNTAATSACGSGMSQTAVASASPTLSAAGPAAGTAGTAISSSAISAVLAAASGANASGTVTFTVFGPQALAPTVCSSGGALVGSAVVSGGGGYQPSAGVTPTAAGDYWWFARYGGDSNNAAASSVCGAGMAETVVGKASPSLSASGPVSGTAGVAIAAGGIGGTLGGVSGANASGAIAFTVFGPQASAPTVCSTGGAVVGSAAVGGGGSSHSSAGLTPTAAGDYWWYASYGGDANNAAVSSACGAGMAETVVAAATPTLSAAGPATGMAGTAITASSITAALAATSGANASGTITLTVFGPQTSPPANCASGGTTVGTGSVGGNGGYSSSTSFTPVAAGGYWWYASYAGDSNNTAATSACGSGMSQTAVASASPTLSAAGPAAGTAGTAISSSAISAVLAAASGANASGTVTFTVFGPQPTAPTTCTSGGTTVGTATVSGNGTSNPQSGYTPTAAGDYWWYASYSGDGNNSPASSTCAGTMAETVVSSPAPATPVDLGNNGSNFCTNWSSSTCAGPSVTTTTGRTELILVDVINANTTATIGSISGPFGAASQLSSVDYVGAGTNEDTLFAWTATGNGSSGTVTVHFAGGANASGTVIDVVELGAGNTVAITGTNSGVSSGGSKNALATLGVQSASDAEVAFLGTNSNQKIMPPSGFSALESGSTGTAGGVAFGTYTDPTVQSSATFGLPADSVSWGSIAVEIS